MYEIGDVIDVETDDFWGTVEIIDKNADGTYETVFYPEDRIFVISESDITGYACKEERPGTASVLNALDDVSLCGEVQEVRK